MINIAIRQDERSGQYIISGHAGFAEPGQDIICAGVSTLVSTLANLVQEWADRKLVTLYMVWPDKAPHHIYVETQGNDALNAVLEIFTLQFCQFAGLYPQHVKIQILDSDSDERSKVIE